MDILVLAEYLEARAPESSAQTKTPGNTPRAKARPTQDGRRGLQRQRERAGGCRTNRFRRKAEVFSLFRAKRSSRKFSMFNNMCITAVLLYQYTGRHCRRPPWEKRKIHDCDHSTRTLTLTLIGTLWGDQCLHAGAWEGSRLIRPTWLLCLERI